MVALVQRVREASVRIDGNVIAAIDHGLLILFGVHQKDTENEASWLARKCANLRIFRDEEGRMNRSLTDVDGEALVVSQFTLYGDASRGNRPSFERAATPEWAEELYRQFIMMLDGHLPKTVKSGEFGAMMDVHLINDGPVTLWIERLRQ